MIIENFGKSIRGNWNKIIYLIASYPIVLKFSNVFYLEKLKLLVKYENGLTLSMKIKINVGSFMFKL